MPGSRAWQKLLTRPGLLPHVGREVSNCQPDNRAGEGITDTGRLRVQALESLPVKSLSRV
jgi:hypothetical protein